MKALIRLIEVLERKQENGTITDMEYRLLCNTIEKIEKEF